MRLRKAAKRVRIPDRDRTVAFSVLEITKHRMTVEGSTMMALLTRRNLLLGSAALSVTLSKSQAFADSLTPEEARAIAKEATIYGVPMLENYRIMYSYFVNRADPDFKAPWNTLNNVARVFTPDDKAIQTPNSDTPYSQLGA